MLLDIVVPGREIFVANGPIHGDTLARVGFEIEIAQTITVPPPQQRAAADLVAAVPVEALDFRIGRILVRRPPVQVFFVQGIVALQDGVGLFHRAGSAAAVRVLPGRLGGVDVVFDVFDVLAALQQNDTESFFREFFSRPAARYARADDDRVIGLCCHPSPP